MDRIQQQPDDRLIDLIGRMAQGPDGAAARRDREDAFRTFYELTSSRMYGLALRVLGNREWAEDALQEAYMTAWRSADTYSASLSPPLAWLGVVVRSRALDFLRRRKAQGVDRTLELDEAVQESVPAQTPSPPELAEASQQAWALHECLRKLESRQREVLSLAYLRDLSHGELAQQLKLPLGTVKTWIRRGIDQLRVCLAHVA